MTIFSPIWKSKRKHDPQIREIQTQRQTDAANRMRLHSKAFESATWIYFTAPFLGFFLPYPMWALPTASCVVLEEERVRILEWFTVLDWKKPVSNVPSTMAAVEAIWKRRDLESASEVDVLKINEYLTNNGSRSVLLVGVASP